MFCSENVLIDAIIFFTKLFYWSVGLSTITYKDGNAFLYRPWPAYSVLLMVICLSTRLFHFLQGSPANVKASMGLSTLIYTSMKFFETFSEMVVIIVDSLMYSELKLNFHRNLLKIDNILCVSIEQYSNTRPKIAILYASYILGCLFHNILDKFLWPKGWFQLSLMVKMCTIDLFLLQFCVDTCGSYCRLQVINTYLRKVCKMLQRTSKDGCDLTRTSLYLTSWYDDKISKETDVSILTKAYSNIVENTTILKKRVSAPVNQYILFLFVYGLSFFSFIVIVNLFAKIDASVNPVQPWKVLSAVLWFSHFFMYILVNCLAVEALAAECTWTKEILGKISIFRIKDGKMAAQLSQFRYLVERNDLRLNIAGLFPGDLTLFCGIVALTASYSIIFVQMS